MINNLLKQLDFGDKEITIYLAILKHGKVSPADLSKITGINRSTVYCIADELCQKGVIIQDLSGAIKYYMSTPPEELEKIIKNDEKKLEQKKVVIAEAISELKNHAINTQYAIPKLRYIVEEELEGFFFKQNEKWEESALETDPCWYGFQDHAFVEGYQKYINWYWSRPNNPIKLKLLSNQCQVEADLKRRHYKNRKIKFLTQCDLFSASTMIIGDYIIMVVSNQRPHYAIEIKNRELAKNFGAVFNLLWKSIK